MKGEQVQDQITGYEVTRKHDDIVLDYDIRKAAFEEHKNVLQSKNEKTAVALTQITQVEASYRKENVEVCKEAAKKEDIRAKGLSSDSKELRENNNQLRKTFKDGSNDLKNDQFDNKKFIEKHDDVIQAYTKTIERYNNLLGEVERVRNDTQGEVNRIKIDMFDEEHNSLSLMNDSENTTNNVASLTEASKRLRTQLSKLETKYQSFLDTLVGRTNQQEKDIEDLENRIRESAQSVQTLSSDLGTHSKEIDSLHEDVDKENATDLNSRLRQLIDTLIAVDSKRQNVQKNFENAQSTWSIKLQLYIDEASRRSRETARDKRIHEIEKLISKIDQITREIYRLQTEIEMNESKLLIDANLDMAEKEIRRELESTNLKLRWANDERRTILNELEIMLTILRESDIREMQTTEIQEIRIQIEEITHIITQMDTEIRDLEDEIGTADKKVNELRDLLEQKNSEISELNSILKERESRINQLKKELGFKTKAKFKVMKGDTVDEMLAEYLNIANCRVPVRRLGNGFYLFGTKKIYAKIMNGKLVVRVGGGYMIIDEFVATYEEPELNKLYKICEREGVESIQELDLEEITGIHANNSKGGMSPGGRSPKGKSPKGKSPLGKASPGRASPNNRSFKGASSAAMNGTTRSPRVTAAALKNARNMQ